LYYSGGGISLGDFQSFTSGEENMIITQEFLEKNGACPALLNAFWKELDGQAPVKRTLRWLRRTYMGCWEAWFLTVTLPVTQAFVEEGANPRAYEDRALKLTHGKKPEIHIFLIDQIREREEQEEKERKNRLIRRS